MIAIRVKAVPTANAAVVTTAVSVVTKKYALPAYVKRWSLAIWVMIVFFMTTAQTA
jgi:hypothetical protein